MAEYPWLTYKISVILPSNKTASVVARQSEVIDKALKNIKHELIIVDNEMVQDAPGSNFGDKYVFCDSNTGCGRGWNIGANHAEGEVLVFYDDGISAEPSLLHDCVEMMYFHLTNDLSIGMIGFGGGYREVDKKSVIIQSAPPQNEPLVEVDEISGFFWATRFVTFFEVGGIDARFSPAGWEETDYAFKVRSKGFRCVRLERPDGLRHTYESSVKKKQIHWLSQVEWTRPDIDERNKRVFFSKWAGFPSCSKTNTSRL